MEWVQTFVTIMTSVICSIVATSLFWKLSFKAKSTNMVFSSDIERSFQENRFKLRLRIINTGPANLFDIRFVARLFYRPRTKNERLGRKTIAHLSLGQRSMSPILYGKKEQMKRSRDVFCWTLVLEESDDFYRVFSRDYYPDHIKNKAEKRTLKLDDVIEEYNDSISIRVYAFGIDSMTGIEKLFISPRYRVHNIITGRYNPTNTYFKKYNDYVNYILSVHSSMQGKHIQ